MLKTGNDKEGGYLVVFEVIYTIIRKQTRLIRNTKVVPQLNLK